MAPDTEQGGPQDTGADAAEQQSRDCQEADLLMAGSPVASDGGGAVRSASLDLALAVDLAISGVPVAIHQSLAWRAATST